MNNSLLPQKALDILDTYGARLTGSMAWGLERKFSDVDYYVEACKADELANDLRAAGFNVYHGPYFGCYEFKWQDIRYQLIPVPHFDLPHWNCATKLLGILAKRVEYRDRLLSDGDARHAVFELLRAVSKILIDHGKLEPQEEPTDGTSAV